MFLGTRHSPSCVSALLSQALATHTYWPRVAKERWRVWWGGGAPEVGVGDEAGPEAVGGVGGVDAGPGGGGQDQGVDRPSLQRPGAGPVPGRFRADMAGSAAGWAAPESASVNGAGFT